MILHDTLNNKETNLDTEYHEMRPEYYFCYDIQYHLISVSVCRLDWLAREKIDE